MKRDYKHVFFDLDHTLWDFERNAESALEDLYFHYELINFGVLESRSFVEKYKEINEKMWALYRLNKIDKETLRRERFVETFKVLGVPREKIPTRIWEHYLEICPLKPHTLPNAFEILNYLKPKYALHLITNGFKETQIIKLSASGLGPFFSEIIISEDVGFQKPHINIFKNAFYKTGANNSDSIIIGDSLEADIAGGISANMDQVYFNPGKNPHEYIPTYEISNLIELKELL